MSGPSADWLTGSRAFTSCIHCACSHHTFHPCFYNLPSKRTYVSQQRQMAFCTRRAASTSIRMTCFLELLPCRRLGFRSSGKLQEETQSQQATTIPSSTPIEEETVAGYRPDRYYPAQIGETLHGRYRIVGKLGYGVSSTVWMCRDLE